LVRHPKKKKPIKEPDPTDSENKDIPPTEPVIGEEEKSGAKGVLDRLFWLRVILAVIGGLMATILLEPIEGEERRWASIALMIVIFIISIVIWKSLYRDSLKRLPITAIGKKKLVTTGIGSFIFLYLFVWILSYTIVNSTNGGLMPPFP
jgi:hypothetical protein